MSLEKTHKKLEEVEKIVSTLRDLVTEKQGDLFITNGGYFERIHKQHDDSIEIFDCYYEKGALIKAHTHEACETFIVINGEMEIIVDGIEHNLSTPGSTAISRPNAVHEIYFRKDTRFLCVAIPAIEDLADATRKWTD